MNREGLKKAARLVAAMAPKDQERVIGQLSSEAARALRVEIRVLAAGEGADEAIQSDFLSAWQTSRVVETPPAVEHPAEVANTGVANAEVAAAPRETERRLNEQLRREYLDHLLAEEPGAKAAGNKDTGNKDTGSKDAGGNNGDNNNNNNSNNSNNNNNNGDNKFGNDNQPVDSRVNTSSGEENPDEPLYRIDPAENEEPTARFIPIPIRLPRGASQPRKEPPKEPPKEPAPGRSTAPRRENRASGRHTISVESVIPWAGGGSRLAPEEIAAQCRRAAKERPQTIAAWLKPLSGEETEEYLCRFPAELQIEVRRRLEWLDGVDLSIGELLGRHLGWPGSMGKEAIPR